MSFAEIIRSPDTVDTSDRQPKPRRRLRVWRLVAWIFAALLVLLLAFAG